MSAIHISVSAETVFHIGPFAITNSILASWIVSALIISIALWANANVKRTKKPTGLQNFLEMLVEGLYSFTHGITESSIKTKAIFPFVFSFFIFIILNNWFGLVPGVGTIGFNEPVEEVTETEIEHVTTSPLESTNFVPTVYAAAEEGEEVEVVEEHTTVETVETETVVEEEATTKFVPFLRAGTADINTTLALALISCVSTWIMGIKFLGVHYFARFKNPLELISEFSRLISFTFRLFGNIFAGEVLLVVMMALVPVIVPSVFYGLEVFVGLIQAFVFAILTLVFMNLATEAHGDDNHAHQA